MSEIVADLGQDEELDFSTNDEVGAPAYPSAVQPAGGCGIAPKCDGHHIQPAWDVKSCWSRRAGRPQRLPRPQGDPNTPRKVNLAPLRRGFLLSRRRVGVGQANSLFALGNWWLDSVLGW